MTVELTREHVRSFCREIESAAWNWDLAEFCKRTGLDMNKHGKDKFFALTRLNSSLSELDLDTLCILAGVQNVSENAPTLAQDAKTP